MRPAHRFPCAPGYLPRLLPEGRLAQVMDIAESLGEAVAPVAQESIMDTGPMKLRRNVNRIQSGATSAGMSRVMSESIR
jgi:hypothetical protein